MKKLIALVMALFLMPVFAQATMGNFTDKGEADFLALRLLGEHEVNFYAIDLIEQILDTLLTPSDIIPEEFERNIIMLDSNNVCVYRYQELLSDGTFSALEWRDCTTDATVSPTLPLVPVGSQDFEFVKLCDDNGAFLSAFLNDTFLADVTLTGATYSPVGTVKTCDSPTFDSELLAYCDDNGVFLRQYAYKDNVLLSANALLLDGVTAYTPVGTVVKDCVQSSLDNEVFLLCDYNPSQDAIAFTRTYLYTDGIFTSYTDSTLTGTAYTITGSVSACGSYPQEKNSDKYFLVCAADGAALIGQGAYAYSAILILEQSVAATVNDYGQIDGLPFKYPVGYQLAFSANSLRDILANGVKIEAFGNACWAVAEKR